MAQSASHLRPVTTVEFYSTVGAALMDPRNYSQAICDHLVCEKECIKQIIRGSCYTTAVEVGCADGSVHMQTLLSLKLHYLGIDLVPGVISVLNDKLQGLSLDVVAHACVLDAHRLAILRSVLLGQNVLLVFSFNSFGNVVDPNQVIAQASIAHFDFLVLTYRTNRRANECRREYYSECDLSGLRQKRNERGVVFCSDDGLHSYAYRHDWLMRLLQRHPFSCMVQEFGMLGRLYWCRRSKEI